MNYHFPPLVPPSSTSSSRPFLTTTTPATLATVCADILRVPSFSNLVKGPVLGKSRKYSGQQQEERWLRLHFPLHFPCSGLTGLEPHNRAQFCCLLWMVSTHTASRKEGRQAAPFSGFAWRYVAHTVQASITTVRFVDDPRLFFSLSLKAVFNSHSPHPRLHKKRKGGNQTLSTALPHIPLDAGRRAVPWLGLSSD